MFDTMHYFSVPNSLTITLFFHCRFSHMPNISFLRLGRHTDLSLRVYYYDIEVCPLFATRREGLSGSLVKGLNFSQNCRKSVEKQKT